MTNIDKIKAGIITDFIEFTAIPIPRFTKNITMKKSLNGFILFSIV